MESTDLFSRSVEGQPVERVALLRRLVQPSPIQRALVIETRARMVGAGDATSVRHPLFGMTNLPEARHA